MVKLAAKKRAAQAKRKPATFGPDVNSENPLKTTKTEPVELKKGVEKATGSARELGKKIGTSLTKAAKIVGENINQTIENGAAKKIVQ